MIQHTACVTVRVHWWWLRRWSRSAADHMSTLCQTLMVRTSQRHWRNWTQKQLSSLLHQRSPATLIRPYLLTYGMLIVSCKLTSFFLLRLLSAIVQARRLSLFGHIARMPDEADARSIITASPSEDWRRPPGRPRTTWMKTIRQDRRSNNLSLDEAITVVINRPLWRLMSAFGATHP